MILDAAAAKMLAAIIVLNLYGPDTLNPQLPLQVEDRQTSWLVKGTPYTDEREHMRYVQFHMSSGRTMPASLPMALTRGR